MSARPNRPCPYPGEPSVTELLVALDQDSLFLCITPLETERCSAVCAPSSRFKHLQWAGREREQEGFLFPAYTVPVRSLDYDLACHVTPVDHIVGERRLVPVLI